MKIFNAQFLRWLAWILVAFNIIIMGTGLAFQVITNAPFLGGPILIHISEIISLSGFAVIGGLILSRHPRHPVGWAWLLESFAFGVDHFAWGYAYYGAIAHPGALPMAEAAIIWMYWLGRGSFGLLSLTLLFLLFPTGKPFSRRWGWVGWIAAVRSALSIPVSAIAPDPIGTFPFSTELVAASDSLRMVMKTPKIYLDLVGILCLGAGLISLVVRLIRAKGVERQQLKWFFFPAIFFPLAILLISFGGRYLPPELSWVLLVGTFFGVTASLSMASASAIAIFRYRMWDIDIIIHRTLVYGLLSSLLVFIYFSSVVLFQQVLQALTGQGSTPAVVISTLMVVAIFTPLRRRIQDFIDRRFYRRKYNAEKIMAAWNAGIRDEVDIDQLSLRLVGVVEETLQPERVSLWLKKHKRKK